MSTEENKVLVRRQVEEIMNRHDAPAVDRFYAESFVNRKGHPELQDLPAVSDREDAKKYYSRLFTAFPDLHVTIEDEMAEGDKVMQRKRYSGTHLGDFLGVPPTGKRIEFDTMTILRIVGDKITEHWGIPDYLSVMQQLGMIEKPGQG